MRRMTRRMCLMALLVATLSAAVQAEPFELRDGDRVVFIGATLVERAGQKGFIETALTMRFPDRHIIFRNLGWSADTVWGDSRGYFGGAPEGYKRLMDQLDLIKPTVIFVNYGFDEAYAGPDGLDHFVAGYNHMLDDLSKHTKRIVVLSPTPMEHKPAPLPDPAPYNANFKLYTQAISKIAAKRGLRFVDLFDPLVDHMDGLTYNSIHFTDHGYEVLAAHIMHSLDLLSPGEKPKFDPAVRKLIDEKNQLCFYRFRPANVTYLFLFRKHEQGNLAPEIPQFDPLIAKKEVQIHQLAAESK